MCSTSGGGNVSAGEAVLSPGDASGVVRFPEEPFGRPGLRSALYESFVDATRGNPTLVLLTGAGGAGKSTLLADLRKTARTSDALVLSGGWTPLNRDIPFRGLGSVCEQLVDWVSTLDKDERTRRDQPAPCRTGRDVRRRHRDVPGAGSNPRDSSTPGCRRHHRAPESADLLLLHAAGGAGRAGASRRAAARGSPLG